MPCGFATTPDGLLLIADGFGPILRWDSFKAQAEPAGVVAPTTAPVVGGTTTKLATANIVGTYTAYVRFVDDRGNYSSLSPISNEYTTAGATGTVTDATAATPIVVTTDAAHGLSTGARVKIEGVGGNTDANGTWDVTVLTPTTFSLDDSSGDTTYSGGGTWAAGISQIQYTSVPVPTEPKVRRRQIIRNTDGQARTYYVDVDTDDLTATTFTSTNTDADLLTQTAVALIGDDGEGLTNLNDPPPQTKAVIAHHSGRMFGAVEVEYAEGAVAVTYGSTSVVGIATEWTAAVAGRFLWVKDSVKAYEIESVNTLSQTLTLTEAYLGDTDPYAQYAIRPDAGDSRTVPYTEAGLPESWPPTNSFALAENGDTITGLMVKNSFLYVLERKHVWKFTFQSDPADDGYAFPACVGRGCINNRCWVLVEDASYMLDEKGIHQFDGDARRDDKDVSTPVQTLFRPDATPRINWSASRYFHAVLDSGQETIRWFVALSGQYLPRHAICYAYNLDRWWLEEYPVPVGASVVGKLARQAALGTWGVGREQVFLGLPHRKIAAQAAGPLDGLDPDAGTHAAAASSATQTSLTAAVTIPEAAVGCPVAIASGRGAGQVRVVTAVDGQVMRLKTPWATTPDATSTFQIGAIPWEYRSGWFRWIDEETNNGRRVELMFEPTEDDQKLTLRRYRDRTGVPVPMAITRNDDGVRSTTGSGDLAVSLNRSSGFVQTRLDGSKELYANGPRLTQIGLSGFGGREAVKVYQITIDGVRPPLGE